MPFSEHSLVDRLPIATFVIDRDHKVVHWNQACEKLTGLLAVDVIGTRHHWRSFLAEARPMLADLVVSGASDGDISRLYSQPWQRKTDTGALESETFFPDLPGGGRWLIVNAAPLKDGTGAVVGAIQTAIDITDRKQVETRHQATRRLMTEIIQGNPVPTFVIDADHTITHWNRACEVVMGIPAETMIGTRDQWRAFYDQPRPVMADLILDEARRSSYEQYYQTFKASAVIPGAFESEAFFPHFPGGGRWLAFTAAPLHGLDGAIIGAIETLQDITERKRAEKAHAESQRLLAEEKYRILFNEMINGFALHEILVDEDGRPEDFRFIAVNPAYEAMTGLRAAGIIGRTLRQVMPKLDRGSLARCRTVAVTGLPDTFESQNLAIGKFFELRAFLPTPGQLAVLVQDVTARKQAEQRLTLLASVFEHTQEGIVITDPNSRIIEVNDAYCVITGYDREALIGQTPRLMRSGQHGPEFYAALWRSLLEEGLWRGEVWNRRKDGEMFPEQLTISAVYDQQGQPSHYVGVVVDITAIKRHEAELDRIAHYDALTGLPNRVLLHDRMKQAIARAHRERSLLAVCFLDVDGFKPVNDTHGHGAGDLLLIELADRFRAELRGNDTVARLGGDEFIILLADLHDQTACIHILQRILATVSRPFDVGDHRVTVTASIGVTLYPERATDTDTLLRQADQAMYKSKQMGKNTYFFYDDDQDVIAIENQKLIKRIEQALADEEMVLHYQPKVNMRTGTVVGAEALIRWRHPERGLLPPSEFLPLVEDRDLIITLGDWVIREALRQLNTWGDQGLCVTISVNISARHLQRINFVQRLEHHLRHFNRLKQPCLEIEITETAAINDLRSVTKLIEACRALGVTCALDDFGTGYSSLTYLKLLPVHTLKIDKSFILDMGRDAEDHAIVSGIVGLAKAFDLTVIAEGVETEAHGLLLLALGCDLGQGYGIAPPMSPERFPDWARQWHPAPNWAKAPMPLVLDAAPFAP